MAELADAPDSKSGSFGSEGSTPSLGTTQSIDGKQLTENKRHSKSVSCLEFPRNSGITIRKISNTNKGVSVGFSYLVTIPSVYCVGGRIRKQFKHIEAAKLYASVTFEGIRRVGISFTKISGEDFGRVLSLLGEASKRTLGELCGELIKRKSQMLKRGHIRSVTERTFRGSCGRIKREIGSVRLRDITVRFVTNWIINFSGSTRTKRNYLKTLSEILNYGVFCEYIKENPIKRLPVSD